MHQHMQLNGASAGGLARREAHWPREFARTRGTVVNTRARTRVNVNQRERGAVLVEFALILIAFYLLFAGTFEIGRMVFSAQILQNAARVGARELALIPLPATYTFDKALGIDPAYADLPPEDKANVDQVRELVYDPRLLAVNLSAYPDQASYDAFVSTWPPLNRMLLPLMLREDVGGAPFLRYPGALVSAPGLGVDDTGDSQIVMIPVVTSRGTDGVETIEWHHVVEEVRAVPNNPATGAFSLIPTAPQTQQGLVALRINYPFQAATLTAFQTPVPGDPIVNHPVLANDDAVSAPALPDGMSFGTAPADGTYGGQFGLGSHFALAQEVRPYRRTLAAQSIFRREVFK